MELLNQRRRVWIDNHPVHTYVPGWVEDTEGNTLIVVDDDGEKFKVDQSKAQTVDEGCLTGVDDLLMLGDFNEAALLHNIRVRYLEDKIYTGIGNPILISVNPYKRIGDLYSKETQLAQRKNGAAVAAGQPSALSPHLYSVAYSAFRAMLEQSSNQSIIISGESGAGKTEATKHILAFLADLQSGANTGEVSIEQQVLDANPVLEAFGNAKTVRNDNSSRFGKFVEVEFDKSGKLLSAQILNYLLEKCRIVTQQPEERNYHIFYQLCNAANPDLVARLKLEDAQSYEYTKSEDTIPGVDDSEEFARTVDCMISLGFTGEERDSVLSIVAAVLHLGNMRFTAVNRDGQDGSAIEDEEHAKVICDLLGLDIAQLHTALEQKTLEDRLTKKKIHMSQDTQAASYARHSFAKVVYARLFDWLVWRINESLATEGRTRKDLKKIGLLDIYGFEQFDLNSFEQLCINFANEKLQQHFNTHMFTLEQRLYTSEGISWNHITWQDNQNIIDCIEKKPLGVFCLVDSECLMPSATDATLLGKIHSSFKNSKIVYKPSRFASMDFAVAHYAGEVIYNVETFLEKNTDKLHGDITNLLKASRMDLVKTLFTDPRFLPDNSQPKPSDKAKDSKTTSKRASTAQPRERQNVTVGMVFREQLDRLVEDLNKTNPRYVRCIKPNANKLPLEFDSSDVLRQLRCAGMLESIRIRTAGYAVRRPFKEFFTRFRLLQPSIQASGPDPDYRTLCQRLMTDVEQRLRREIEVEDKSWQMGQTRLFMKDKIERHCERLLVERSKSHVITLQRRWRGFVQRKEFLAKQASVLAVQSAVRTRAATLRFKEIKRRHAATLLVQGHFRVFMAHAVFLRHRVAATTVQRFARGWHCRSRIGKVKGKLASEKVRRLREEEQRRQELEAERRQAEEMRNALEAARRELARQQEPELDGTELLDLQEENKRLQERLAAAPVVAAAPQDSQTVDELKRQIATLQREKEELKSDLARAESEKQALRTNVVANGDPSKTGQGNALDTLRTEILNRLGPSDQEPVPGGALPPPPPADFDEEEFRRKTLMCQREYFEKLKEQFQEAQATVIPADEDTSMDGEMARMRGLEEEVRRLKRENASLKTNALSCQEEATERSNEASSFLEQMSQMQAEVDDFRYSKQEEISNLRRELQNATSSLLQQTEDMARLNQKAQDAESKAAHFQAKATRVEEENKVRQEQLLDLEKGWMDLDQQLAVIQRERSEATYQLNFTKQQLQVSEQEWHQEREKLYSENERLLVDLRGREAEVAQGKRRLEELLATHYPIEEVQKWKQRAEMYEREYHEAMRYNKEMSSAVGQMTHAASQRGGDWEALQEQNLALKRDQEKKDQALKMAELEKVDIQKQLDNVQSSCTYFQNKYKEKCNELKSTKKDQSIASEGSLKTQSQLANVQNETEELRRHAARLKWQLCEAMNKRQEDSTKLQSIGELVNSVSVLHLEQLNAYAKEHGDIRDEALRRFFQEKRDQARKVISRLKTLASDEAVGSGAEERDQHNQPAQQNGQSNLQQQQQQQQQQQNQQNHQRSGTYVAPPGGTYVAPPQHNTPSFVAAPQGGTFVAPPPTSGSGLAGNWEPQGGSYVAPPMAPEAEAFVPGRRVMVFQSSGAWGSACIMYRDRDGRYAVLYNQGRQELGVETSRIVPMPDMNDRQGKDGQKHAQGQPALQHSNGQSQTFGDTLIGSRGATGFHRGLPLRHSQQPQLVTSARCAVQVPSQMQRGASMPVQGKAQAHTRQTLSQAHWNGHAQSVGQVRAVSTPWH